MANYCYNYFGITAPTAALTELHNTLSAAPAIEDADGWVDVFNLMLATDPTTGELDSGFYEVIESEDAKRYPFDTQWNMEHHDDGTSTLRFSCYTKHWGFVDNVCAMLSLFGLKVKATRFEYFELAEEDHGYWGDFKFSDDGAVAEALVRQAVETIYNDCDDADDEELIAPADWEREDYPTLTLWDDGTISSEMDIQPVMLKNS